jgi:predicted O-methyltransferase YrrM
VRYEEFFARFGGALRTKNLARHTLLRMVGFGGAKGDLPSFDLPRTAALPRDFIRLCPWEAEYLFTVASHTRVGIIEIGRFNGGSCFLMSIAAPEVPIYSIDIAPRDDARLRTFFAANNVGSNVQLIIGDSRRTEYPQIGQADLLFIDGDHSYEGCLADLKNWYGRLVPGGHLVLHDCYTGSWGVQQAVLDFVADHPELESVQSPYIGPSYWRYPAGSIAHFVKRASRADAARE